MTKRIKTESIKKKTKLAKLRDCIFSSTNEFFAVQESNNCNSNTETDELTVNTCRITQGADNQHALPSS